MFWLWTLYKLLIVLPRGVTKGQKASERVENRREQKIMFGSYATGIAYLLNFLLATHICLLSSRYPEVYIARYINKWYGIHHYPQVTFHHGPFSKERGTWSINCWYLITQRTKLLLVMWTVDHFSDLDRKWTARGLVADNYGNAANRYLIFAHAYIWPKHVDFPILEKRAYWLIFANDPWTGPAHNLLCTNYTPIRTTDIIYPSPESVSLNWYII